MGVHPLHDARRICFAIQEVHRCSDKGDANLLEYLGVSERTLENGFNNYVRISLPRANRIAVKVSGEEWNMHVQSIPDTEGQISIAEMFLANGKLEEARRHLELLAAAAPDSTRVSYYR